MQQLPLSNSLIRSKSAHLSQMPSLFAKINHANFQNPFKKNAIKLLKQSFPPDFFTNGNKFEAKNMVSLKNQAKLPQINHLKVLISKNTLSKAKPLDSNRIFALRTVSREKLIKKNVEIFSDFTGISLKQNEEIFEEIHTPCFPKEKKYNQKKIFFCKGKDYIKV